MEWMTGPRSAPSGPFSETWPTSGSMRNGECSPRPPLAHPISEIECSSPPPRGEGDILLPTPCARPSGNPPEVHLRRKPGRKRVTDLAIIVENGLLESGGELLPTPLSSDYKRNGSDGDRKRRSPSLTAIPAILVDELLPTPRATDGAKGGPNMRGSSGDLMLPSAAYRVARDGRWGKYTGAIRRWEALTRPAPEPMQAGRGGRPVMAPAFAEWVMGWPSGLATDPALGLSRAKQLMVIGNGVVPAQGAEAISQLLDRLDFGLPR